MGKRLKEKMLFLHPAFLFGYCFVCLAIVFGALIWALDSVARRTQSKNKNKKTKKKCIVVYSEGDYGETVPKLVLVKEDVKQSER